MRRKGFTLVELLVVIAVIVILISILLPALGKARRTAQTVQCASNMRQLIIAQRSYAYDFKGALVEFGISESGGILASPTWVDQLEEYYDTPLAIRSPVDTSPFWPIEANGAGLTDQDGNARLTSYGLNELVTPNTSAIDPSDGTRFSRFGNLNRLRNPHACVQFLIMAYEGPFAVADHVHPFDWWLVFDPAGWAARAAQQVQTNAHGGPPSSDRSRSNYAFLDGHVETAEIREVYATDKENNFDPRRAH